MTIKYIDSQTNNIVLLAPLEIHVADREKALYVTKSSENTFSFSIDFTDERIFNSVCSELYQYEKLDLVAYLGNYEIHHLNI
ncbi:MAG: hypothetical protein R3Y29_00885 [bacterium]